MNTKVEVLRHETIRYLYKTTWVDGIKHFPKNFKICWFSDEALIDV